MLGTYLRTEENEIWKLLLTAPFEKKKNLFIKSLFSMPE